MTEKNKAKMNKFRDKLATMGWKMDTYGNMKKTGKEGTGYRFHFKDTVVRFEKKSFSGDWTRIKSGLIKNADVEEISVGIKLIGFDR